ncbi:GxxExxY protein [Marinilabilia salmonicolor]|uniref:GxxExxY protein n=1 Tax=Marinilabilia salmonicolor TaxID=989 RepID=A0A368V6N8_9BACT|nr:GxxExxY protein [Marinilabilia salmonicolor]RCW36786.1 GxxExxY protein [Marinilabilia salmonicolor]
MKTPTHTKEEIDQLTHKIIGCAMEVHNELGNGFQEVIYQRALAIEFGLQGIAFERELPMELRYKNEVIGSRRVDFFVEECVMVEIKAIEQLENVNKTQAINYCEAYHIADGLLINFGGERLDFKRVFNKKMKSS